MNDLKKRTPIKIEVVKQRTGLAKPTIYRKIVRKEFPSPVRLGSMTRWVEDEIDAWINAQIATRDA